MANDHTPPKTLVFSFDGTGNEPRDAREFKNDESVSNEFMIGECKRTLGNDLSLHEGVADDIGDLFAQQEGGLGLAGLEVDDIVIHPLNGMMHVHSGLMAKTGSQEPRQVCVNDNDRPGKALPIVHHSVKERFDKVSGYRPPALRGLEFRLLLPDGSSSEELRGISGLREWATNHSE